MREGESINRTGGQKVFYNLLLAGSIFYSPSLVGSSQQKVDNLLREDEALAEGQGRGESSLFFQQIRP